MLKVDDRGISLIQLSPDLQWPSCTVLKVYGVLFFGEVRFAQLWGESCIMLSVEQTSLASTNPAAFISGNIPELSTVARLSPCSFLEVVSC